MAREEEIISDKREKNKTGNIKTCYVHLFFSIRRKSPEFVYLYFLWKFP